MTDRVWHFVNALTCAAFVLGLAGAAIGFIWGWPFAVQWSGTVAVLGLAGGVLHGMLDNGSRE